MARQESRSMGEFIHVLPTVEAHSSHDDGVTLHTTSSDTDKDIEIYDDGRDMHLAGNPTE